MALSLLTPPPTLRGPRRRPEITDEENDSPIGIELGSNPPNLPVGPRFLGNAPSLPSAPGTEIEAPVAPLKGRSIAQQAIDLQQRAYDDAAGDREANRGRTQIRAVAEAADAARSAPVQGKGGRLFRRLMKGVGATGEPAPAQGGAINETVSAAIPSTSLAERTRGSDEFKNRVASEWEKREGDKANRLESSREAIARKGMVTPKARPATMGERASTLATAPYVKGPVSISDGTTKVTADTTGRVSQGPARIASPSPIAAVRAPSIAQMTPSTAAPSVAGTLPVGPKPAAVQFNPAASTAQAPISPGAAPMAAPATPNPLAEGDKVAQDMFGGLNKPVLPQVASTAQAIGSGIAAADRAVKQSAISAVKGGVTAAAGALTSAGRGFRNWQQAGLIRPYPAAPRMPVTQQQAAPKTKNALLAVK